MTLFTSRIPKYGNLAEHCPELPNCDPFQMSNYLLELSYTKQFPEVLEQLHTKSFEVTCYFYRHINPWLYSMPSCNSSFEEGTESDNSGSNIVASLALGPS